ncbi:MULTISPECIES: glycosyltransferase family 2 protein [unclassified Bradyrhizobium]|uniref:glycosyltransferase family 2 protein n=1 Tax=unclassified Bradyrhizobium TaxID=2631580 RepID=UPI0028EB63D6|nr:MULTISPECIES: glycosyltransferase family 2 protein [unclassified Bradyrhizobium]
MTIFLTISLTLIAGIIGIPIALLMIEVCASLLKAAEAEGQRGASPRAAVVVPAHNESGGIVPTLRDLRTQMTDRDRLIVVADNCSDDTATVAYGEGAEVIERHDPSRIGKGFALAYAVDFLRSDPPEIIMFVDADCCLSAGAVRKMSVACSRIQKPLQCNYRMTAAPGPAGGSGLAQFAWTIKNWVRPLGLSRLGWPVQLMGTGMAFPWHVIERAPLANGDLVEDMKLGLDLAEQGYAPRFFPFVEIVSEFPVSEEGADRQRQRWIQGHLSLMTAVPRLILRAVRQRNWDLLLLALDIAIPPLSLLVLLTLGVCVIDVLMVAVTGALAPFAIAATDFVLLSVTILIAWAGFGRNILPFRRIVLSGLGLLRQMKLFVDIFRGRGPRSWIRTERRRS